MVHCVLSPRIHVIHLTINVRRIQHVYLWSMAMNVTVRWVKRVKIVKKVSNQIVIAMEGEGYNDNTVSFWSHVHGCECKRK